MAQIFIDGEVGTTGLQIRARLSQRDDLTLLAIDSKSRKDPAARAALLNSADVVILCLPDAAAREAVALIENPAVRVIDASTAHRVAAGWVYGFPELCPGHAARVAGATRVSNPGCYPTGAVALLRPLIDAGLLPRDFPITVNAVSGYSGGGRKLIDRYEDPTSAEPLHAPFYVYGLNLEHKHVAELHQHANLIHRPLFVPSVGRFAQGMIVQVPLQLWTLTNKPTIDDIHATLVNAYRDSPFVSVAPLAEAAQLERLEAESLNGTNQMHLYVFGHANHQHVVLAAVLDNLGKGASGAAVQNLNLMLGVPETLGLK